MDAPPPARPEIPSEPGRRLGDFGVPAAIGVAVFVLLVVGLQQLFDLLLFGWIVALGVGVYLRLSNGTPRDDASLGTVERDTVVARRTWGSALVAVGVVGFLAWLGLMILGLLALWAFASAG
jgi:hypothetical protein